MTKIGKVVLSCYGDMERINESILNNEIYRALSLYVSFFNVEGNTERGQPPRKFSKLLVYIIISTYSFKSIMFLKVLRTTGVRSEKNKKACVKILIHVRRQEWFVRIVQNGDRLSLPTPTGTLWA